MRKCIPCLLAVLLLAAPLAHADVVTLTPEIRDFGGTEDALENACMLPDGTILLAGYTLSTIGDLAHRETDNPRFNDAWAACIGDSGIQWDLLIGDSENFDLFHKALLMPDGSAALLFRSGMADEEIARLLVLDDAGAVARTIELFGGDKVTETVTAGAETIYSGGYGLVVPGQNGHDSQMTPFISAQAQDGAIQWTHDYPELVNGAIYDLLELSDGSLVACGYSRFNDERENTGFVMGLDPANGDVLWTALPDDGGFSYLYDLAEAADGGVISVGCRILDAGGPGVGVMVRIGADGTLLWSAGVGDPDQSGDRDRSDAGSVLALADGTFVVAGHLTTRDPEAAEDDWEAEWTQSAFVAHVNGEGVIETFARVEGMVGSGYPSTTHILQDADGQLWLCGETPEAYDSDTISRRFAIAKIDLP